jgi:hypothetical protein
MADLNNRAAVGRPDYPAHELHPEWEREWVRHPAQIELLQTIVMKLDELIALAKREAGAEKGTDR